MGLTEAARRAGNAEATRASKNTAIAASTMMSGSKRTYAKEKGAQQAGSGDRPHQAKSTADGGKPQPRLQNKPHDSRALRTEGHPDGHLLYAGRDRKSDHAVDAKHRQQHRGQRKTGDDDGVKSARRFAAVDYLLHSLYLRQRQLRIDGPDSCPQSALHLLGRQRRTHDDETTIAVDIFRRSYAPASFSSWATGR